MGIFMNTRRSGSVGGHVTAELEALTNEALIGSGDFVFAIGNKLAITVTPGVGTVSVSSGVFSWCGRLGGVDTPESVRYTPPDSETLFKKIVVCAKYSKNLSTMIESISMTAFESEIQASESAAASLSVDTGSADITSATETAYLPLWEFVATSSSNTVPVQLFKTVDSLSDLLDIKKQAESEKNERTAADADLKIRVDALEKSVELISDSVTSNYCAVTTSQYIGFVCMIQTEYGSTTLTPFFVPAVEGYYYKPFHKFTERSVGFDVETFNSYVRVQSDRIDYGTGDKATGQNVGSLKAIYGIR